MPMTDFNLVDGTQCRGMSSGGTRPTRSTSTPTSAPSSSSWSTSASPWALERSEKDQNCKLQFPQPDYWPRRSPDFRTVFQHFPCAKLSKREVQTNRNWKFQYPQPDLEPRHSTKKSFPARARSGQARRACALRALGLLLADGTPTVGGGKTFWAVSQIFLRKQL